MVAFKKDAVKLEGNVPIICDNIAKGCNLNEVNVNNLFEALNRKRKKAKKIFPRAGFEPAT